MAMDGCSCEQLWNMSPIAIGAAWTESMKLGAVLNDEARETYCKELETKNAELWKEVSVSHLQLHILREDLGKVRERGRALKLQLDSVTEELQETQAELSLLRREREERLEQERLAIEIWGPRTRPVPDATWDPPPVLLSQDDQPITVRRVAGDLGVHFSRKELQEVEVRVRDVFLHAHGHAPVLRAFHGPDGASERVGCFTERDRELIASVVRAHALCKSRVG